MSKRKPSKQGLYIGKGGQLAVMAEFAVRGYNVAMPEIDVGDDLFVVHDENGQLQRVQVKTANARELNGDEFVTKFNFKLAQLAKPRTPDLYYVMAVRRLNRWAEFIVISRRELDGLHTTSGIGHESKGQVIVEIRFSAADVHCKNQSLQAYRNNWKDWPIVQHDQ